MKTAAKVMYIIGNIGAIFEIILAILGIVMGIYMMSNPQAIIDAAASAGTELPPELATVEAITSVGVTILVGAIIFMLLSIVMLCLAISASRALDKNPDRKGIHIIMLVLSIFIGNIFYFLGGLFGILTNGEKPAQVE